MENGKGTGREDDPLTHRIIACALQVHRELGPGMLESAYQKCLAIEFAAAGLAFEEQREVNITYRDATIADAYRMDFVVENEVVVEIKAIAELLAVHDAQLLSYLRFSGFKKGLLINFNVRLQKHGLRRSLL